MHFLNWKLSYNLLRQYYNGLDACSLNAKVGKLVSTCPWNHKSEVSAFQNMKVTVDNFEQCQTPVACLVGGVTIAVTRPEQWQGGQWHGNCDDYYECGHEKYDDRVAPVKCHHSGAQPSQASPGSYFMTGALITCSWHRKYKLKCTNCTSKLLVPAHTYLDVMFHIVWSILSVFGLYAELLHSVQTFPDIGWPAAAAAGVGLPLVQSNTALSQADTVSTVDIE